MKPPLGIATFAVALLSTLPALAGAATNPPAAADARLEISYKRDPRMVDAYRGVGEWADGPSFTGASAQDRIVARARVVDAHGKPVAANPEWVASDPEMVTISPGRGEQVTISVHRAGESRLAVSAGRLSQQVVVRAQVAANHLLVEFRPPSRAAPAGPKPISPELKGSREQVSYAVGLNLARTLAKQSVDVDPELVKRGFVDVRSGGATLMSDAQARNLLVGIETQINLTDAGLQAKKEAQENRRKGEAFLAKNRKKKGVVTLASGLQYEIVVAGDGKTPTLDDVAVCHYRGTHLEGSVFDDSRWRKTREPVPFPVKGVIPAWQEALQLMPAGSKWRLFVPPALAYGEKGAPRSRIGPNETLVFEVELLSVEPPGARQAVARVKAPKVDLTPEELERINRALPVQPSSEPGETAP